uniref:ATXR3 C-terminal domain-containing protein n=1 Tax=Nelumbo nucifera TaxID=4432 RepID=A0A822YCJ2_NELNU|nr:TPA_asm: hypothetical protein HUJ06_031510 [Nelumbo nucifera]
MHAYRTVTSPPVYISPLDLGPKYTDKLGSGFQEYCKTYGENYCLGQLIYWHNQANADPDCSLGRARRGCLLLPDSASFYAKVQKPLHRQRVYGPRTSDLCLQEFLMEIMQKILMERSLINSIYKTLHLWYVDIDKITLIH